MDASEEKPITRLELFVQDGQRVITRRGKRAGEDADFLFILNEAGQREAIAKRLIVRFIETPAPSAAGAIGGRD